MNDDLMVTIDVVIDAVMQALAHSGGAAVLTVAVVAAKYCGNDHERAWWGRPRQGYLSGALSPSRFNRRLQALGAWRHLVLETLGELSAQGAACLLDSRPVPVCRRARARRCRQVRGKAYCGYCAARRAQCFGWRLHLVCTPAGVPVAFALVPGGLHDLTPVHELPYGLPGEAAACTDKADNAARDEATTLAGPGGRSVPIGKANRRPHLWADNLAVRE